MTDLPDTMDEFKMAHLAREMSMAIRPYTAIFKDFDLTEEQFYEIQKHPFYIRASEQFLLEWNSSLSAAERVKLISAAYAEQGLPVVGQRMLDPKEPFTGVLEAYKSLCRTAGIGEIKGDGKPTSERFQITINLGADVDGKPVIEKYDKSVAIDVNDSGFGKKVDDLTPAQLEMFATKLGASHGKADREGS